MSNEAIEQQAANWLRSRGYVVIKPCTAVYDREGPPAKFTCQLPSDHEGSHEAEGRVLKASWS